MIVMRISTSEALSNKQVVVTALIIISYYFIKYVTMVMVSSSFHSSQKYFQYLTLWEPRLVI